MNSSDTARVRPHDNRKYGNDMPFHAPDADEPQFLGPEYPAQLRAEFVRDFFAEAYLVALPRPVNTEPPPLVESPPRDRRERDAFEDFLCEIVDGWTEEEQATVYWYLHASGMNLHKAQNIRRRVGLAP